jgi:2-C-methyl-D-erythritol 2,4-cyclodiphosphate synthase
LRVGFGYDSHRFAEGRKLVLGGVEIEYPRGLLGHSDGDALLHAVVDSIIGALGKGDIGGHFPDTDPGYKDASSVGLLLEAVRMAASEGYDVSWTDTTVVLEEPRLAPHVEAMRDTILKAGVKGVNIKAKSNEEMDATGRGEGVVAYAVSLLTPTSGT